MELILGLCPEQVLQQEDEDKLYVAGVLDGQVLDSGQLLQVQSDEAQVEAWLAPEPQVDSKDSLKLVFVGLLARNPSLRCQRYQSEISGSKMETRH